MVEKRELGFWMLIGISILLALMFLTGQSAALFAYDYIVSLGLQESEAEIGKVGVAFAKGFGFGDTLAYLPMMLTGVIGLLKKKAWGLYAMFGSLAISIYWPLVHLYAIWIEREAIQLNPDKYLSFSILLPLIVVYGLWGMRYLYKNQERLVV